MAHFDRFSILKDNQHGFRKRRSCETQLIVTIQEIASKLSKGQQVDVILLDFAKAFDKVPHSRLLYKLDYYGVRGQTNTWIKGFLSDRKQQVLLEGTHSIRADVLSGFHRVQSWVRCSFSPTLMTCQTHSDPQMQDCLLMTASSTALSMEPRTILCYKKTSLLLKNGNAFGR